MVHSVCERRKLAIAKYQNIARVIADGKTGVRSRILLDRKQRARARLKVHMIGRRGAAFRTVINHKVAWKGRRNIEHRAGLAGDPLRPVLAVNDREMAVNDREWIAVDCVIVGEGDALLLRIQISAAEKARPPGNRFTINGCRCAPKPMRDVPNENIEPADTLRPRARIRQSFHAAGQTRPGADLLLKQMFDLLKHLSESVASWPRSR